MRLLNCCQFVTLCALLFSVVGGLHIVEVNTPEYTPDWKSLDSRPTPDWFDDAKIGIFIHWGVFSVPSFGSEWFWYYWKNNNEKYTSFMKKNYPDDFTYQDFAHQFTAELFNATQWAQMFAESGAKYVVLTSKHHEGYTLWPSQYSFSWNAMDVGPHRDLVDELSNAVKATNSMKFGLYHSMYEWFNPVYQHDKDKNFTTRDFVEHKTMPELYEIVNKYHPEVIWSDGEGEAPDTYWGSRNFLAWLYNESPVKDTVAVNDRWGQGTSCQHGGYYSCSDRYNPGTLQKHKWENAMTLDKKSWGYRSEALINDILTMDELVKQLVSTVSCGGNILINVGPTKEGTIIPIFQERLQQMGTWLGINGEAIYKSKPWMEQNDTKSGFVWYTQRPDLNAVYAITLKWPENSSLILDASQVQWSSNTKFQLLNGANGGIDLKAQISSNIANITLPDKFNVKSEWAWTIKIMN